jgi:hypothetical protein
MTVQQLIDLFSDCQPEAEVRIMSQEAWPFENAVHGVCIREDLAPEDCSCDHKITDPHEEECAAFGSEEPDGTCPDDVFIVEGRQERYGDKSAGTSPLAEHSPRCRS